MVNEQFMHTDGLGSLIDITLLTLYARSLLPQICSHGLLVQREFFIRTSAHAPWLDINVDLGHYRGRDLRRVQ